MRLFLGGKPVIARASETAGAARSVLLTDADEIVVFEAGEAFVFASHPPAADEVGAAADGQIRSPMPGKVTQLSVKAGDTVTKGQALLTLEAMKMEHALTAPFDGTVERSAVTLGAQVSEGATLVKLAANPPRLRRASHALAPGPGEADGRTGTDARRGIATGGGIIGPPPPRTCCRAPARMLGSA